MAQATVLTDADVKKVLGVIKASKHAARNRIAFLLSVKAGLRVAEIAALKIENVLNNDNVVKREIKLAAKQTKGSFGRTVYLNDKLQRELTAYIATLPRINRNSPLICSQRTNAHFSNVTLCMLFKRLYDCAGFENTSHAGRRTFATKLNANGVGMRTIQKLMGHKNIATTAIYCDVNDEQLRNAVSLL